MRFKSLEQAYFLYNYKRVVFRQLSAEGVPFLWHEYKKLRDGGMDAKTAEKAVHDPRIEKKSYSIQKWQMILKAVIRSAEEYERASPDVRKKWHASQNLAYKLRLKNLQARVDVTDEESPQYKEMVELQKLDRFHARQYNRMRHNLLREDFYSLDLENNREQHKGKQTPHGNPMPYQELSQEVYETLTIKEKNNYHIGMSRLTEGEENKFHIRMIDRFRKNNKLPTFAASKYGGESIMNKTSTREEYENMTNDEKRKYHRKMQERSLKIGKKDKAAFHSKMYQRLRNNINLPVFYSPEDEQ